MHVAARMTRTIVSCGPEDTLAAAASRMWDGDCGCLPVVGPHGHVVGMITDRDLCMAAFTTGKPLSELRVAGAMARSVATARPLDSLQDAERTMRQHGVRRLPVVDDQGRILGMLSCNDLFRNADEGSSDGEQVAARAAVHLVRTMAAIGRARQPRREPDAATSPAPAATGSDHRRIALTVTSRQMIVHGSPPPRPALREPAVQPIAGKRR